MKHIIHRPTYSGTDMERAMLAMCIDCEGSVTVAKVSRREGYNGGSAYYISVCITNTDKNLIDWISSFGFTIGVNSHSAKRPDRKLCYTATLTASRASNILKLVRPYMIVKAMKADLAIAMQETMGEPGHDLPDGMLEIREYIYQAYKKLEFKPME